MQWIKRLLRKRALERLPWFSQCHVYYSDKGIIVCAVQANESTSWNVDRDPISNLPLSVGAFEIGQAVMRSLEGSHDHLSTTEAEAQYGSIPKKFGEPNWRQLEKNWDLIHVANQTQNQIEIHPTHRYRNGGWGSQTTDPIHHCLLNPSEIGQTLLKIIQGPPPEILHD